MKPKAQGTSYETAIKRAAESNGRKARRLPLTGQKHEPDVEVDGWGEAIPILAWKAYAPKNGQKKRRADEFYVIPARWFWELYSLDESERYRLLIQAKACERVGVRATMLGLIDWIKRNDVP